MFSVVEKNHSDRRNRFKRGVVMIAFAAIILIGLAEPGAAQCLPPITIYPQWPLPTGTLGAPYSVTFSHQGGGYSEVSWIISNGTALPAGMTLDHTTGTLSGTPTTAGAYYFDVRATSVFNGWCYGERRYALIVKAVTDMNLTVSDNPVIDGQALTLTAQVSASGGVIPTGAVQFKLNGSPLGAAAPLAGGVAKLNTTAPDGQGNVTITADYSGDDASWPGSDGLSLFVFNYSIQDDATGDQLFFNSDGTYQFIHSAEGSSLVLKGKGIILASAKGCAVTLEHIASDRRVRAESNPCEHTGAATVVYQGTLYTLNQGSTSSYRIR